MTDISLSTTTTASTTKKAHQFMLYFSYFIFFFPYIVKLFSFLSPLFITTSILLIALLTFSNKTTHCSTTQLSQPDKVSFLFSCFQCVEERVFSVLQPKFTEDHDHVHFEELEVYKIVFDTSYVENSSEDLEMEAKDIYLVSSGETEVPVVDHQNKVSSFEIPGRVLGHESSYGYDDHKTLGGLMEKFEDLASIKEEKEVVKQQISPKFNKVDEQQKEELQNMKEGSNAITSKHKVSVLTKANSTNTTTSSTTTSFDFNDGDDSEYYGTPKEVKCWSPITSRKVMDFDMNLGSFGSMRREREWRRTLACKLFEERHSNINVDVSNSSEGMDLLWETYQETEHASTGNNSVTKVKSESTIKKGQKVKSKNGKNNGHCYDSEEEEEEESEGQLCCLQALKFSTGKMNLGLGRPNLAKFSKAIKGFGLLHNVSRHGKKVFH